MGRNKKTDDRKKKKLSTTIDAGLWDLFNEYSHVVGMNKSQLLEKMIKEGLKDPEIIKKLNDEGIILPDSELLKKD